MTERLDPTDDGLDAAAHLLRDGGLVAFPTETVYGLGADATDARAVARIFEAKGRPRFNPLIVHVPDLDSALAHVRIEGAALTLAQAFWPGPMTLVLPRKSDSPVAELTGAGLPTLAIRIPSAPLARSLLERTSRPLAAPSANPSGRVSPTTAAHVLSGLSGRIEAVLDGGPCDIGMESTILMPTPEGVHLLRHGGLPQEAAKRLLGTALLPPPRSDAPAAPGQLASHYAPVGTLRLNATSPREDEAWLGFGPGPDGPNLSPSGDLVEAAANLFAQLQTLDARGTPRIAVAPIPEDGLGRAINDRLRRAAAPRG